jgi:hypothetical protein
VFSTFLVVGVTAFVDLPTVAGVPTVENIPAVNFVSTGSPSLLLPSSDVPVVCSLLSALLFM